MSEMTIVSARVFVIDDRSTNRSVLSRLAGSVGADVQVFEFPNPVEALEACSVLVPDLVVTDFKMPHMDGAEFIRRLRHRPLTADVPVIVVTAYEDHEIRREALEAGATDFILSPIDPWEFRTRAGNLLKLRAQQLLIQRQTIRESEERFRLLVEGVRDYAIVMLDREGRIKSWNIGAERLLGYAESEILGRSIEVLEPSTLSAGETIGALLAQAAADGSVHHEGPRVRKDGSPFQADILITAMRDDGGCVTGFSMVTHDVTEQRDMEAKLRTALAETQVLLRELHHRVRNNLQVISTVLYLQSLDLPEGGLRHSIRRTRQRVDSLGLLFRHLQGADRITSVQFERYLVSLCTSLVDGFDPNRQVRRDIDIADRTLELDLAGPFGLLFGEILIMAVGLCGAAGTGCMTLSIEPGSGSLAVGIEFDPAHPIGRIDFSADHGLGRTIVDALVNQLGGQFETMVQDGQARIVLTMPESLFQRQ